MLNRLGQVFHIGLAPDCGALASTSHWQRGRITARGECAFERGADLGDQLDDLLAAVPVRGRLATLVVSDQLVRMWVVTPPSGTAFIADLKAAAALRFHALFGEAIAEWTVSANWDAERAFLAVAIPKARLERLENIARKYRVELVEILPQFVAALNGRRASRSNGEWFGFVEEGVLTLAAFDGDSLMAVCTAMLPACPGREWLDAFVEREALRLGLELPAVLQLSGQVPASWHGQKGRLEFECKILHPGSEGQTTAVRLACTGIHRLKYTPIDFSRPSVRRAIWRAPPAVWILTAFVLALGVYTAFGYWQHLARLREHDLVAAAVHAGANRAKPAAKSRGIVPVSEDRALAINGIIGRLNLPWRGLLDAIQSATPSGVALLALEPDARRHTVRITAEARGSDAMIGFIEQMQQQEIFSAVALVQHEINELDQNRPIRFQLEAQWRPRR